MAQTPSRTLLVAGVVVALGALLLLNAVMQRMDPAVQEREAQEAAQKQQAEQAKKQPPPGMPGGGGDSGKLVALGDDAVVGNAKGTPSFVIGYEWTPEVQADPSKVYGVIDMISQAIPGARIRVVNVDTHPDVRAGISTGGKVVLPASPDGSIPTQGVPMALGRMMPRGAGPGGYGGYGRPPGPPPPGP